MLVRIVRTVRTVMVMRSVRSERSVWCLLSSASVWTKYSGPWCEQLP